MSIYDVLSVPEPGAGAEADCVTDAEIDDLNQARRQFKLPELSPEAAADEVRRQRAAVEAFKNENPERWAAVERDAEISRGYSELRRKLQSGICLMATKTKDDKPGGEG